MRACADSNKLDAITAATSKSPQGSTDVTDGQVDTGRPLSIAHDNARSDVYQPNNDRESRQSQATDNATDNLLRQLRARLHLHAPADFETLPATTVDLLPIFQWLEDGILSTDKKLAATLMKELYQLNENNVVYRLYTPTKRNVHSLRPSVSQLVIPQVMREDVLKQAHNDVSFSP